MKAVPSSVQQMSVLVCKNHSCVEYHEIPQPLKGHIWNCMWPAIRPMLLCKEGKEIYAGCWGVTLQSSTFQLPFLIIIWTFFLLFLSSFFGNVWKKNLNLIVALVSGLCYYFAFTGHFAVSGEKNLSSWKLLSLFTKAPFRLLRTHCVAQGVLSSSRHTFFYSSVEIVLFPSGMNKSKCIYSLLDSCQFEWYVCRMLLRAIGALFAFYSV